MRVFYGLVCFGACSSDGGVLDRTLRLRFLLKGVSVKNRLSSSYGASFMVTLKFSNDPIHIRGIFYGHFSNDPIHIIDIVICVMNGYTVND